MSLLAKSMTLILILIIIAVVYGENVKSGWDMVKDKVSDFETKVYYKFNPSAKKTLLIDELSNNLDEINELLNFSSIENDTKANATETKNNIRKAITVINNSKDLLSEIEILEGKSGFLGKGVGLITNLITSDKNQCVAPTPTWTPPQD